MDYALAAAMPIAYHTSWFALEPASAIAAPASGCWCTPAPAASAWRPSSWAKLSARMSSPPPADDRKVEFALDQGADFAY